MFPDAAARLRAIARDKGTWKGRAGIAEHLGSDTLLPVHVDGIGPMPARTGGEDGFSHGDEVRLTPDAARLCRCDLNGQAPR